MDRNDPRRVVRERVQWIVLCALSSGLTTIAVIKLVQWWHGS